MAVNFKDASDFKGRTVNENLYNQVKNMDAIAGANDINVSIHFNAFNKSATGAEVWYYLGDAVGYAIAKKLSAAMANALGIADRGAKATTNLYVISQSVGHTVLAEICFIDNASDIQKYQANKQKLFKAMSDTFTSFSQYNFRTSHGGHYGLNMMDPGAVGNGYKEAVLAQEINQYLLGSTTSTTNAKNGWEKSGNEWYYYDNGVLAKNGWRSINGKWYLFDAHSKMLTGWQTKDNKWYYFTPDGAMHTGWSLIKGKWYLFDKDGAMVEGWRQSGEKWYYFDADGSMKQGWFKDKTNKWYYLSVPDGEMVTGTKSIDGKKYIFDNNGVCTNP